MQATRNQEATPCKGPAVDLLWACWVTGPFSVASADRPCNPWVSVDACRLGPESAV